MFEEYISNDYLRALVILVSLFLIVRLVLLFSQKGLMKITIKTKSNIDDLLIKKLSMPFTILAFFIVLRIAVLELNLNPTILPIVLNTIHSFLVIFIAYVSFVTINLIVITWLKKIASKTKSNIDDAIISLFHSVLSISLIAITFLYILNLWGVQIGPLLAGLGIAGLAIALALQPILSNIFSGVSMIFDQTIRAGDLVYLESQSIKGKIESVGLRSTKVRTFDNELIIIPNTRLADSIIQNVALPEPKSRVIVPFGTAYGSDIKKVKEIVLKEIKTIKGLSKEPKPFIRFAEMADSSLNFNLYFYVETFEDRADAIDEANTRIYNALNKNKIEIPFPQRDVHMKK